MRIVVCAVLGCVTLAVCGAGAGPAVARGWAVQPAPNPPGATSSVLSGVSCASPRVCIAAGYFINAAGVGLTLAERWKGKSWAIQRTPNPTGARSSLLFGVSCAVRRACTAVGSVTNRAGVTVPLAERWNGKSWKIQRTPDGRAPKTRVSYLAGVSCASRGVCVAVGYDGNLRGTAGRTTVERWNGTRWSIQRTPHPAGARAAFLSGVSCRTPVACAAAGFFINRAGMGITLAERWDGTSWSIQRTRTPAAAIDAQLIGVSCSSAVACTSVGYFSDVTGIQVMIAERWNATRWALQRTRYPVGARYVQLSGVSCASPGSCAAVGLFNNTPGFDVTLAEHWNGTRWRIQPTPDPAGATNSSLGAVSCPSKRNCIAVGDFTSSAGVGMTLVERYT